MHLHDSFWLPPTKNALGNLHRVWASKNNNAAEMATPIGTNRSSEPTRHCSKPLVSKDESLCLSKPDFSHIAVAKAFPGPFREREKRIVCTVGFVALSDYALMALHRHSPCHTLR